MVTATARALAQAKGSSTRLLLALLLALAIVTVALRFVAPIADSDVFWQMAYARQMIERGTLIVDHAAFSWTPTSNAMIYCAWIAEFALFGLWKAFGLAGLYALPFAAAALIAGLLWQFARRLRLAPSPFVVFVVLLTTLASSGVMTAKPEVFSVLFTHATLWLYWGIRRADEEGGQPLRYVAALPLLMLVWVNTHGGFILAAPLFAAFVMGELINSRMAPGLALSPRTRRALLAACGACVVATVATPYGLQYPRQLLNDYLWQRGARPDVAWNNAHRSLLDIAGREGHMVQALVLMLGTIAILSWRHRRVWRTRFDAVALLLLLGALPLYILYLRSMYMFVAVFAYLALWLAVAETPGDRVRSGSVKAWFEQGASSLLVFVISAVSLIDTRYRPSDRFGWFGFGISTVNPVEETAYLERAGFHGNLYNTFETGGYIIWKRAPDVKVMVDARSFPYLSWFDDQLKLVSGAEFDAFQQKYPAANVALVDYAKGPLLRNFARSAQWRQVFAGPCAVIFVRVESAAARTLASQRSAALLQLHNATAALAIFEFSRFAGDFRVASLVERQLQSTLSWQLRDPDLRHQAAAAADYLRAQRLAHEGQYGPAFDLMNGALDRKVISTREAATLTVLRALADRSASERPAQQAELRAQLTPLLGAPDH